MEQRLARTLAELRHRRARSTGITNRRIGPQGDRETDLEGIAAELAFCAIANVYPDLQLVTRPDWDARLPDGTRVDVKATKYRDGRLLATRGKPAHPADCYVLMVGSFPGPYECRGFMRAADLLQPWRLLDLGHGAGYAAEQWELLSHPPTTAVPLHARDPDGRAGER